MRSFKDRLTDKNTWVFLGRLLAYSAILLALLAIVVFLFVLRWAFLLFHGNAPSWLVQAAHAINLYTFDIGEYLSGNSEGRPGPF